MKILLKYFVWLLSLSTLIIFFLLSTTLGHLSIEKFVAYSLSKKTKNKIEVSALNFDSYPYVEMNLTLNQKTKVALKGTMDSGYYDMSYLLQGERFLWKNFLIDSPLKIRGDFKGRLEKLSIFGEGDVFEGEAKFSYTKEKKLYKDMNISMHQVNAKALQKFLHYRPKVKGYVDVESHFDTFSHLNKVGYTKLTMQKAFFPYYVPYVPFKIDATLTFNKMERGYDANLSSDVASLLVKDVNYHKMRKEGRGEYHLTVKNLAYFQTLLKRQYDGSLDTKGDLTYANEKFKVKGETTSLGGVLVYDYQEKRLNLKLKEVSLVKMLKQLNYPALLEAKTFGNIEYDIEKKIVLINTTLRETHFRATKMTNLIFKTTGIDMLADVYDESSFVAGYQNDKLNAVLNIDNGRDHFNLYNIVLDKKTNGIDAQFEVLMRGEEIRGSIYGTLKHPKVTVDVKALLKYQVKKKFGSFFK
jgi:hypothetical protein